MGPEHEVLKPGTKKEEEPTQESTPLEEETRREIEDKASLDYARGMSITDISQKYNIPWNTVKNWHRRGWSKLRKNYKSKHRQTIFEKFASQLEDVTDINLDTAGYMAKICNKAIAEIWAKGDYISNLDTLSKVFKLAQIAATIPNLVMPSLPNDLAEKILSELEELKETNQTSQV